MKTPIYVLIHLTGLGDGFDLVGAWSSYEEAQKRAREIGVDKCLVRQITLNLTETKQQ